MLPAVAVMVTGPPTASPVTLPVWSTEAIAELLLVQVTVLSVAFSGNTVAFNCRVLPSITVAVVLSRVTLSTGIESTVMVHSAVRPSIVAVIVAVPTLTPVTLPVLSTVATDSVLLLHSTVPVASSGVTVAVSWVFSPTCIVFSVELISIAVAGICSSCSVNK